MKTTLSFPVLLSLCAALLVSCIDSSFKGDGSVSYKDIDGDRLTVATLSPGIKKVTVPLSELVESCDLIHFENTDDALFKAWFITVTDHYIGIRQESGSFKLFDRNGKFLCNVGAKGNGPGEYKAIHDELIDENGGCIYLSSYSDSKILVYDLNGKHIKDIKVPYYLQKPTMALSDDGRTLILAHIPFEADKVFAFQIDMEGNVLKELAPKENMRGTSFDDELLSFRNTSEWDIFLFNYQKTDTLYHLDVQNLSLHPVFTMNMPATYTERPWYHEYREYPDRFIANLWNWNTKERLFFSIDKNEQTTTQVELVNDFFGHLKASFLSFNRGYYASTVEPGELKELIEERLAESDCSQADADVLKPFLTTLEENANNLLFVGKLKQ